MNFKVIKFKLEELACCQNPLWNSDSSLPKLEKCQTEIWQKHSKPISEKALLLESKFLTYCVMIKNSRNTNKVMCVSYELYV